MPWKTLELDPASATERDIKRAYAKRLKTCRPDQDPEGFRQLHEAYTIALAELHWRQPSLPSFEPDFAATPPTFSGSFAAPDSPGPALQNVTPFPSPAAPAPSPEPANVPLADPLSAPTPTPALAPVEVPAPTSDPLPSAPAPAFQAVSTPSPEQSPARQATLAAFDRLQTALQDASPEVADLVRAAESALYAHPGEVISWGDSMGRLIALYGENPGLRLKPDAMLFELEHQGLAATLAVIDRLDRQGNAAGIANLATLFIEHGQRIATHAGALAAASLAGAAAFWNRRHADPLANFAYQHLARGERDFQMQLIDRHRSMNELLTMVPDHLKSFWRQRLISTPGRDAWNDAASAEALRWLRNPHVRRNPAYEVLLGLLPADLLATIPQPQSQSPSRSSPSSRGDFEPGTRTGTESRTSSSRDNGGATFDWEQPTRGSRNGGGVPAPRSTSRSRRTVSPAPSYSSSHGRSWSSGGDSGFPRWTLWLILPILKMILLASQCSNAPLHLPPPPPVINATELSDIPGSDH